MKKSLFLILSVIFVILLSSFTTNNNKYELAIEEKLNIQIEDSSCMFVNDLKNNEYAVVSTNNSYFIYSIKDDIVLEYSLKSKSPFVGSKNPIYCGPNAYFERSNAEIISLTNSLEKHKISSIKDFNIVNKTKATTFAANSTVSVKHPEFFYNDLKYSCGDDPYSKYGDCGYVGLAMMIAYADKYKNDNVMSDVYYQNDRTKTGLTTDLPKYLKTLYPKNGTISTDIMNTMKEYSKFNKINVDHYSRWLPFFTGNHLIDTVANDTPVELFGDFSSTISNASAHAIVGYGHVSNGPDGYWRCHFGWNSNGNNDYSDVHVNNYTLGSVYYFKLV